MQIDGRRLIKNIEDLGKTGLDAQGRRSRTAASDADKAARDLVCMWMEEAGMRIAVDKIGNIFGIWDSPDNKGEEPFMTGSHIDTVINAGKYEEFAAGFFRGDRRTFSGEAFRHLYDRFAGITWYIQSILNRIWTHGRGLDSAQQVDDTVDELVAEAESFYFDLLRSQTAAEQSILKAVGREGVVKSISGGDFITRNALPAASTVRSAAAKLAERDLLYRSDAGYVVYDRFFGLWLKRL